MQTHQSRKKARITNQLPFQINWTVWINLALLLLKTYPYAFKRALFYVFDSIVFFPFLYIQNSCEINNSALEWEKISIKFSRRTVTYSDTTVIENLNGKLLLKWRFASVIQFFVLRFFHMI